MALLASPLAESAEAAALQPGSWPGHQSRAPAMAHRLDDAAVDRGGAGGLLPFAECRGATAAPSCGRTHAPCQLTRQSTGAAPPASSPSSSCMRSMPARCTSTSSSSGLSRNACDSASIKMDLVLPP